MTYTTRVRVLVLGLLFVCILPFGIARADDAATSTPVVASSTPVVTEQFGTVRLTVRDGDIVATSTMVGIPLDATSTLIAPTGTTTPVLTSAQSVLAVLVRLAASSSEFTISDLQYYPSFGSFYLNCLTIPSSPSGTSPSSPSGQATSTPLCGQWQYSVNNFTPAVGMDSYTLKDGDTVFVYFGYPRKVTLESASVASGTPFTATAVSYDPATDTYSPASCLVVGVTQADPANPYTPTVIATSTSDAAGHATFTLTAAGDYFVGLEADYYTPATSLSVSDTSVSVPPPTQSPTTGGGGGSPATTPASRALAYLLSQQKPDGSITRMFIDDWAALALAAGNAPTSNLGGLSTYLASAGGLSLTADFERRAMALEALGQNPYTGDNVVQKIIDSFDGTQFGDPTAVNDDIFALFPLLHAGYTASDPIIIKDVHYILSQQGSSGSWGSVDLTAAAMQALAPLNPIDGVPAALAKAKAYLASQEQSGCFNNAYTTSWVLQAIAAFGETPSMWAQGGTDPLTCLTALQQADGGFEPTTNTPSTRVWATSYALLGLLAKPWDTVMQRFSKQESAGASTSLDTARDKSLRASPSSSSGQALLTTTTLQGATSTMVEASSTLVVEVATSTLALASSTSELGATSPRLIPDADARPATLGGSVATTTVLNPKRTYVPKTSTRQAIQTPASRSQLASAVETTQPWEVHRSPGSNKGLLSTFWHYLTSLFWGR